MRLALPVHLLMMTGATVVMQMTTMRMVSMMSLSEALARYALQQPRGSQNLCLHLALVHVSYFLRVDHDGDDRHGGGCGGDGNGGRANGVDDGSPRGPRASRLAAARVTLYTHLAAAREPLQHLYPY